MTFTFPGKAVKFDENRFFKGPFQNCPEGKGVDFLAAASPGVLLLEVKDCAGDEKNNLWRINPNNASVERRPKGRDIQSRESLDIEMAKKVSHTLVCLYGAWTKEAVLCTSSGADGTELAAAAGELSDYWKNCTDLSMQNNQPRLRIVLFLEGEFGSDSAFKKPKSKTRKQILLDLSRSIKKKLSWLNCTVAVVNTDTYRRSFGFTVS